MQRLRKLRREWGQVWGAMSSLRDYWDVQVKKSDSTELARINKGFWGYAHTGYCSGDFMGRQSGAGQNKSP